jgi:Domain of unknown function (DUF4232)
MRAGASLGLRIATAAAFGATAALAVILNRGAPVHAALASEKGQNPPRAAAASQAPAAATASPAASPAAAPRCALSGLRISVGTGSRVTTETTRYALDFTNVGGAACTLTGYPEVAAYQGDGTVVGDAAVRDTSVAAARVVLAPGQTAHASLDASLSVRCRPVRVTGLRVVPPSQSAGRFVKRSLTACAALAPRGEDYLQVRAIEPGSGAGKGAGREAASAS